MAKKGLPEGYIFLAVPYSSASAELRDAVNIASAQAGFQLMRADQQFAPSALPIFNFRISESQSALFYKLTLLPLS